MKIPKTHPRHESLRQRHKIVKGWGDGYVAKSGLIAHGRGEAFDYLLGEKTTSEAKKAEETAVAMLLLAKNPVISVNGNVAALVPREIVKLAKLLNAKLEVNLFYYNKKRKTIIEKILLKNKAGKLLCTGKKTKKIPGLDSSRALVHGDGIWGADVVLVPLEDGDRAEALVRMRKKVIAIDLNPLSRTSKTATVTIVDNVTRAIPNMIKIAEKLKRRNGRFLKKIIYNFDNEKNLKNTERMMRLKVSL